MHCISSFIFVWDEPDEEALKPLYIIIVLSLQQFTDDKKFHEYENVVLLYNRCGSSYLFAIKLIYNFYLKMIVVM